MKKRGIQAAAMAAAVTMAASLFGCAAAPAAPQEAPAAEAEAAETETAASGTRIFTDSVGREVELDAEITRIARDGSDTYYIQFAKPQ